jgi:hypothetical protein
MKKPYAYLRKSRVFRDQRAVSPEMQLDEVRTLAGRYGHKDLVVLSDMNISGRKGRSKRPGFDALLRAIEAGEVEAVYSYSLSRLSRSLADEPDGSSRDRGARGRVLLEEEVEVRVLPRPAILHHADDGLEEDDTRARRGGLVAAPGGGPPRGEGPHFGVHLASLPPHPRVPAGPQGPGRVHPPRGGPAQAGGHRPRPARGDPRGERGRPA